MKINLVDFGNLFRADPAKLSDQELLALDLLLHQAWKHKRAGGAVHLGDKSWSFEDLVNLHALVRKEMSRRAFQHTIKDEMDDQTQPFLKAADELAPVYPSGVQLGREITLGEVLPQIKSFYAHPIFAWIVGGLANWGKTKGDIDVLWWATLAIPEYLKKILEFRFGRQFKDGEIAGRVQHHLNAFQGPFTKAVPIYALKVERINLQGEVKEAAVQEIGFKPEPVDLVWDEARKGWTVPKSWLEEHGASPPATQAPTEKQLRSASADVQAQAETSAKDDQVKLFKFFYPLKPTKGHKPQEPQSVETFLQAFKDDDFPVYSSKKYDGADYVVFRDSDKVQMISEDGRDNTGRFPEIVEALKSLPVPRFALLAEVERWDEDKHLPRETVTAYVNAAGEPDDSDFVANIYDVVFFESENARPGDIHKLPFVDRLRFLESLGLPQSTDDPPDLDLKLNMVPHYRANNKDELREQTERLRRLEGSEGNVAKRHDFIYNLENKPSGMVKFHNAAILRGIVTEVKETKTPDVFNFFYGLDFQNMRVPQDTIRSVGGKLYHEVGTTFSSALSADIGDVIELEFETLNLTRELEAGTVAVTAWAPRVLGISKKGPMTVGEAVKAAREGLVLQEKDITGDGQTIYKGVRQAFGSYGGKRALAHKIASFIPHHRTYVEPFAGGAAVLYAKDPSPKEALNDRDAEIAFMHRFIRDHNSEDRQVLAKRDWTIRKDTHERLKKLKPESDRDRFHKAFYLTRSSYGKMRGGSFNPANEGVKIDFPDNIERAQVRLRNVAVTNKDYLDVLKKHDGQDTFFYMDPPYPGEFNLFDFGFDEKAFIKALKGLKAKWIVSYTAKRASVFKGFNVYRVKRRNQMKGPGGNQEWVTELMVSNFPLKPLHLYIEKELEVEPEGLEAEAPPLFEHLDDVEIEKVQAAFKSPGGKYRLCKKIVRLLPEHKSYVEAFCGGAQVLFHKKRSDQEVINDVNADLVWAYRFIKGMTPEDLEWLKKQNWIITRAQAKKLFEMKPHTLRYRFYRFAYLNKAQYWGRTDVWEGMRPNGSTGIGARIRLVDKLPKIRERLQGVKLHSWDWRDVIKEYDSPDAFFYLDPPYPLHWPKEKGKFGAKFFREEDMIPVLKGIKGRFLLSYELEKARLFKGFKTYRIKTLHTGSHQLGGARKEYELLVSNYPIKPNSIYIEKSGLSALPADAVSARVPPPHDADCLNEIIKQDPVFDANPPEDESYRYVIQHHWRGRTVHADFRVESIEKDFLIGWTLADLVPDVVKEPVETLDAAKKWSRDGSAFKIDFKAGRFKERRTRGDNVVPADIRAFPKAKEPHVWLEVEGVTPPFPAPGATRQFRGVFYIEDEGVCEYGAQKLDAHEYFLDGKLKGRLVIRRLAREALAAASKDALVVKVLPPGQIDEAPVTATTLWVAIQPLDQTPIVLTDREVEKKWLPPFGISALPKVVRGLISPEFQYWQIEDRAKALQTRDGLVAALKNGEVKIDFNQAILGRPLEKQAAIKVPFTLQYQFFRGPIVVRSGPSEEFWSLRIALSPDNVLNFQLSSDPLKAQAASATLKIERTDKFMNVAGDMPPGSPLNPTKNTPSSIIILDRGEALVLIDDETFKKFEFRGEKLRGLWIARRPDVGSSLWEISRSQQVSVDSNPTNQG